MQEIVLFSLIGITLVFTLTLPVLVYTTRAVFELYVDVKRHFEQGV